MKVYCYVNPDSRATLKLMTSFSKGCNGELVEYKDGHIKDGVLVLRSRSPEANSIIRECWATGQTFIFIDTGYFMNQDAKNYHRVTKNHFQNYTTKARPSDRWEMFKKQGVQLHPWKTTGNKILICEPTEKSMGAYDITVDQWMNKIIEILKISHPDKEIIFRTKPKLDIRREGDTLERALLDNNVWTSVSFQGAVAIESILLGIPAFVHEHNAAASISQTDFSKQPIRSNREKWLQSISYDQFTVKEMESGFAFQTIMF